MSSQDDIQNTSQDTCISRQHSKDNVLSCTAHLIAAEHMTTERSSCMNTDTLVRTMLLASASNVNAITITALTHNCQLHALLFPTESRPSKVGSVELQFDNTCH